MSRISDRNLPSPTTLAACFRPVGSGLAWALRLLVVVAAVPAGAAAATFNVTRYDDPPPGACAPSDCSLREAIEAANAMPGKDLIRLPVKANNNPPTTCHQLTRGQLEVDDALEIRGIGGEWSCIYGNHNDRILRLAPGRALTLRKLELIGGDVATTGGAIDANGSQIVLERVRFRDNRASGVGGALRALDSTVDMDFTYFEGNQADAAGGAIFGSGQFTFDNGSFSGNQAGSLGGAVSLGVTTSQSAWKAVTIEANAAAAGGGGFHFNGGVHHVEAAMVFDNDSAAAGGGLRVAAGQTTVVDSHFADNHARDGGAISVGNNNDTTSLLLTESVLENNGADEEGGGLSVWGELTARNVTVSGNSAAEGAGIHSFGGELKLRFVTLANNQPTALHQEVSGASTQWENTIVSGGCVVAAGPTPSLGGSLEGPGNTCGMGAGSDLTGQTAQQLGLMPLAPSGGTFTHALTAGSNAVGHAALSCSPSDQRFYLRDDGDCDSGAHERGALPLTFVDVPRSHFAWAWIEAVYQAGVTGGCGTSPLIYCPGDPVSRAQMAVFLLKAVEGESYDPPPAIGVFHDVAAGSPFAAWIEELAERDITGGCGTAPPRFCPASPVTRGQMAVFLLRAFEGAGYVPPPATGEFDDVPANSPFAPWIEELADRGITGGCGTSPPLYCPASSVTRAQMAIFLAKTFGLSLP